MDEHAASERAGVRKPSLNDSSHAGSTLSHPGSPGLNPRSCVTCRRRKVKCDKRQPCSNCVKQHIECVFPAPGRAPRRTRKAPDSELLQRLRKLEGVVKHLGASVEDAQGSQTPQHQPTLAPTPQQQQLQQQLQQLQQHRQSQQRHDSQDGSPSSLSPPAPHHPSHTTSLDSSLGRLVINEGRSRYVKSSFWASLSNEVEDLKTLLNDESEEEADEATPESSHAGTPGHSGFMFGFSSLAHDVHHMHPAPHLLAKYWQVYEEHCDPLVKMVHLPTMREVISAVKDDPGHCSKGTEALLFAIYFATVTSLSSDECLALLGEERKDLVTRYRFAVEQSLARAHFLTSEELTVLQAFVLFLICLRRHEDIRVIWSLCGLVVRIAMSLGLHRDGSNFGLSPFDIEIRRRIWWQICILDIRTSEDHGSEPTIIDQTFDTKYPLNVNDSDLTPSMSEAPRERGGITEMTFSLIRYEIASTYRRMNFQLSSAVLQPDGHGEPTLADKERLIEQCHTLLEDKYLRHCDMSNPMHWVICTVARLIMAKMWLIVYHPHQRLDGGASLPQETRDRLFITSLESIEYALLLETEVRSVKWGWLFRTYCQWHALAFLLSELCVRTRGITVQRAWRAVDATVVEWGGKVSGGTRTHLWRPLRKLIAKARDARERELASDKLLTASSLVNYQDSTKETGLVGFGKTTSATSAGRTDAEPEDTERFASDWLGIASDNVVARQGGGQATVAAVGDTVNGLSVPEADAMMTAPSPFFANQPPIELNRWNNFAGTGLGAGGNGGGADWLMGDGGTTTLGAEGFGSGAMPGLDSLLQDESGNLIEDGLDSRNNSVSLATPSEEKQVGGKGHTQKPMVPWEDWDEMVQNFELASGQAMPLNGFSGGPMNNQFAATGFTGNSQAEGGAVTGNAGQTGAGGQAWGARRPVMGETWF